MNSSKSLTLVELLVASAVFVVIMVTIYSAFHTGIFGYRNMDEALSVSEAGRSILNQINLDLRNCFAYSKEDAKFNGENNKISFLTLTDSYLTGSPVKDYAFVSYELKENKLLRYCRRDEDSLNENLTVTPEEMADNIEALVFKFFDSDAGGALQERPSWNETANPEELKKLPAAVAVDLTIKDKASYAFQRQIFLPLRDAFGD